MVQSPRFETQSELFEIIRALNSLRPCRGAIQRRQEQRNREKSANEQDHDEFQPGKARV